MKSAALLSIILFTSGICFSQGVKISTNSGTPDPSAILDAQSTTQGFLPPRMTTADRIAISNPAPGLHIFNTSKGCIEFYTGTVWKDLCGQDACSVAPAAPGAGTHSPQTDEITWNWNAVNGASGYKYNTVNDYGSATNAGEALSVVTGSLTCQTNYSLYVWAYNACGASPATVLSAMTATCPFVCGTSTMSDVDGNTYNTVLIGSQCWMRENLNTTKKPDNSSLTRYCYNNNASNCTIYGGLYTWTTTMNGASSSAASPSGVQGICPTGWHLPSSNEWLTLQNQYGAIETAGGSLKETGISHWLTPNTGATNASGFTALPGGSRYVANTFGEINARGDWWGATQASASNGTSRNLYYSHGGFYESSRDKGDGVSVRCVRD